jgi:hypothetical protein
MTGSVMPLEAKGKASFLKTRSKKLFFNLGRAGFSGMGPKEQKFFEPLFSKKAAHFLLLLAPIRL